MDAPELNEMDYVKRFRDVDVDRLISQFGLSVEADFGINNEYGAVRQVDDLSLTEDLNDRSSSTRTRISPQARTTATPPLPRPMRI